ncbi:MULTISPECIES: EAL domain-containing protein [Shewanella]|nr:MULTISPECIES: EAL domain-containing protein [Shewanella]
MALTVSGYVFAVGENTSILLKSKAYSIPDGLSQIDVTSVEEGKSGHIWIGTVNGLNRFDGKNFKHYFSDETSGLPSSFIRSLIQTENHLLIGTDRGLVLYDQVKDSFKKIPSLNEVGEKAVWSISKIDNNYAIATNENILIIDNKLNIINTFTGKFNGIKKTLKFNNEHYIREYDGKILNINKGELIATQSNDFSITNKKFFVYTDQGTFIKTENSLSKVNDEVIKLAISKNSKSTTLNNNSEIYAGEKKLGKIEATNINAIYHGKDNIYVAIKNSGFEVIPKHLNTIAQVDLEKNLGNVWSIFKDTKDRVALSTDSPIIYIYDSEFENKLEVNSNIEGPKSVVIKDESLYIGSEHGIFSISLNTGKPIKINEESVFIIKFNASKDKILAGTASGSLITIDLETLSYQETPIDKGNPVFDILIDENETYIATQGGLHKVTNGIVTNLYKNNFVVSLSNSKDEIFFGTSNSVKSYNKSKGAIETIYNNKKPVFSLNIIDNLLFAASIKEVAVIDIVNKKRFILTEKYGSQDEYNAQSALSDNYNLYLGGMAGLSKISIKELKTLIKSIPAPAANLDKLLIFNLPENINGKVLSKPLSLTEKIKLKYSDYPFSITFNSPDTPFNDVDYKYQMSGLSNSWIESQGTNSATYTNLSPGEYTFNVYAIEPLTKRAGDIRSLLVEITPPWWLSIQAKLVYLLITLLITGAIVKAALRRREVQRQIAKSEERLKLSLWGSGDEMWDWDIETGQIYRSNIWGSLEFPRDGQRSGEAGEESNIHPMDQERVNTALNKHFYGETDHFEAAYRVKGKDDQWIWILDRAKIVERDENDKALRMTGTIKNISNFKQAEEQLRLFERAIENISEGMFILDNKFKFVEVNEACCDLCEKGRNDFIGELFQFDLYPESYSEQIRHILQQQGSWSNEVESSRGDGSSFLMELTVDAIYDEQGVLSHYVGVFSDISRRKQQEEELRKLTNNDLLTSLPNRSSLMVTLGNLVKKDTHHTLMVLDLDNFKKINDSLGHQVGDELLIKVARRIESTVPYHTSIYRLGGDEFAILVDNNPDIGSSAVIANHVVDAFSSPFELTKDRVVVGVSIGIVLYPEDDQNEQALLRKADIAMYHAKSAGGNRYQFYSESLNRNAIRQLEVENLIREGLRDDLFEVYYQPKIDLRSSKMAGMEALVRLNHPKHGLISPGEFIPLAEENGLIVEIGEVVLRKACFAAQNWRRQKLFNGRVAVNLSSQQFALPDLQQRIESILRLTQLPAANLELEITEGTVIKQPEKAIKVMMQLSKMGVSLALDDFGTGYSSLSYLKRFPIDTLKIDKAFVDDIDKSDRDLKMVDSIITIAHNMGLSVVGEGVEEASQLNILKALKCEEIQGFIYSKAVDETCFTELLKQEVFSYSPVSSHKNA